MAPEANHTEIVTRVLAANNHYEVLGVDRLASVAEIERARKRLQEPPVLKRYCNVKKPFTAHTGAKAGGMDKMLRQLQLPLVGRHHLGIDDARNEALHELLSRH